MIRGTCQLEALRLGGEWDRLEDGLQVEGAQPLVDLVHDGCAVQVDQRALVHHVLHDLALFMEHAGDACTLLKGGNEQWMIILELVQQLAHQAHIIGVLMLDLLEVRGEETIRGQIVHTSR